VLTQFGPQLAPGLTERIDAKSTVLKQDDARYSCYEEGAQG